MCFSSSAPKVKPIPRAPTAQPEIIDDVAMREQEDLRRRRRQAYGRQSTILAGKSDRAAPPTVPAKAALGS